MVPPRRDPLGNELYPRLVWKHGAYYHVTREAGRRRWTRLGTDYGEAVRRWAEREAPALTGETVTDAVDRFELLELPRYAAATRREYRRYARRLREVFGEIRLGDVDSQAVAQYLDLRSAPVEANREIAMLSTVFECARRWGWTANNPCRGVRRNPERAARLVATEPELKRWRLAAGPLELAATELILCTALRKADVLGLRLADLRPEGLHVQISKKARRVRKRRGQRETEIVTLTYRKVYAWTPKLRDVIARARRIRRRVGSLYLFANRQGRRYTETGFDSIWQRTQARAGVKVTCHGLRRLALTRAKASRGIEYAQALADHEDVSTTERYISEGAIRFVDPLE